MMHFEFEDLPLWDNLRMRLLEGKANAVTQKHLAEATGTSLRAVQEALEQAKRAGECIVTGSAGVWLSYDPAELLDAYRRDRNRAIRQLANNRGRLKAVERLRRAEAKVEQTSWLDAA